LASCVIHISCLNHFKRPILGIKFAKNEFFLIKAYIVFSRKYLVNLYSLNSTLDKPSGKFLTNEKIKR